MIFCHRLDEPTEEDRAVLQEYFRGADYRGAGYTYISNYIWRKSYCLSWEVINGYLFMEGARCAGGGSDAMISMPLTRDGSYDPSGLREAVLEVRRRFDKEGLELRLALIPAHMKENLEKAFPDGELVFARDRGNDEYVYLRDKLITLSGRALHRKKNHLNYFLRTYSYEALPIDASMRESVLALTAFIRDVKEEDPKETAAIDDEYTAIDEMLGLLGLPEVRSVAIMIDGRLRAFAIGEIINSELAVEHFEKADDRYRGLYQAVCSEFCRTLPESVRYVNREEDMGLENLRQAKEALVPDHMEERYTGRFVR